MGKGRDGEVRREGRGGLRERRGGRRKAREGQGRKERTYEIKHTSSDHDVRASSASKPTYRSSVESVEFAYVF